MNARKRKLTGTITQVMNMKMRGEDTTAAEAAVLYRAAASRQMFCPISGRCMDYRRTVRIELRNEKGSLGFTFVDKDFAESDKWKALVAARPTMTVRVLTDAEVVA